MIALVWFLVLAVCLALYILLPSARQRQLTREHGCEPAPKVKQIDRILGLDVIYTQVKQLRARKMLQHSLEQHKHYGSTYSARYMMRDVYATNDPENIKAILSTQFKDYRLGYRMRAFAPLVGRGIFTSDGEDWAHSRSLLRPNFIRAQVSDLGWYDDLVHRMMSLLPRDGSAVDLSPLLYRLQLDAATTMLFGRCSNTLDPANQGAAAAFAEAFDYTQNELDVRLRMSSLNRFHRNKRFTRYCDDIHSYVDGLVHEALALAANEKQGLYTAPDAAAAEEEGAAGERYVFLRELAKQTSEPERLRSELLHVLIAGRDTTASLLSSTFFVLGRRPDIFAKLRAEVDESLGPDDKPSYESMRQMKYLRGVINEVLRLFPSVPLNMRETVRDTVLPRGGGPDGDRPVLVKAGSPIRYSLYALHRRKDVYGEDAEEFRPERWEEGLRPGWAFVPFSGGPRICLGQQLALTQAMYVVISMVRQISDITPEGPLAWEEDLHITLASYSGVQVRLRFDEMLDAKSG